MKTKKLIVTLIIIQLLIIWISMSNGIIYLSKYLLFHEIIGIIILIPLINLVWPVLTGIFAFSCNKKNVFDFVSKFSFFLVSGLNIIFFSVFSFATIFRLVQGDKIGDSHSTVGYFFLFFSTGMFYILLGSIILGIIIFYMKKEKKN